MPTPPEDDTAAADFLLEEYKQMSEAFLDNERMGERRVTWLLTLVTAALGGIGAAVKFIGSDPAESFQWSDSDDRLVAVVVVSVLVLLLMFGLVTLERIAKRNLATDDYLNALYRIRKFHVARDVGQHPPLRNHLAFFGPKTRDDVDHLSLWPGGLAQTVSIINSVTVAGLAGLIVSYNTCYVHAIASAAVFFGLVAWVLQCELVNWRYGRAREKERAKDEKRRDTEIELTFVSDGNRKALVDALNSLGKLPGLALGPERVQKHVDRYYDTPDKELSDRQMILRTRTLDGRTLLCFKGPSRSRSGGAARREFEESWSPEALDKALGILEEAGIKLDRPTEVAGPEEALLAAGLEQVQQRRVVRTIRKIGSVEGGWLTVAEAVVDEVRYRLASREIYHYELEVEAKSDLGEFLLGSIEAHLREQPNVQFWRHSKFAMGKALAELAHDKTFREAVYAGVLGANALARIDEHLNPQTP